MPVVGSDAWQPDIWQEHPMRGSHDSRAEVHMRLGHVGVCNTCVRGLG